MSLFILQLTATHMLVVAVFVMIWEMLKRRLPLKFDVSTTATEFCERVQVGIDVYIPDGEY